MNTIFCKKCHKQAAQINKTEEKIELRQNGKVVISLSAQSTGNNISVRCPVGHPVEVKF